LNQYDLIVTDNNMPKVTGVELIQKLQAVHPEWPVIMVTGVVPDEQFARSTSLQPAVVLLKPYSFDELLEAVKSVLRTFNEGSGANVQPSNPQFRPQRNRFHL
jgi:DNA-binding NarL/FixJ family response regulator